MVEIPVTFVDLETTGLDPKRHEIIEAAALRTIVTRDCILVKEVFWGCCLPQHPVNPAVAKINGYDYDTWMERYDLTTLEEVLGEVFRLMHGSWHAGSNPKFDESMLVVFSMVP